MCVPNFIQIENLSASKGWRRKKWSNHKAQTSRDSRPVLLPITKSWVKWNVEIWDFTCSLVSYLHSVCAKIHPNRTTFRVKGLAQKKVVKPKRSIVTRCLTYSASNNKIWGQRELKKLKLCMYLVNYFSYVCAKFHPNWTIFSLKRLTRRKGPEPKRTNFTRCSTYTASNQKILSQGERRKLRLCMYFS